MNGTREIKEQPEYFDSVTASEDKTDKKLHTIEIAVTHLCQIVSKYSDCSLTYLVSVLFFRLLFHLVI